MNDTIKILILIVLLIIAIVVFVKVLKYKLKHKVDTIVCYTGGLGAGKTLLTVQLSRKLYKKNCRIVKRKNRWITFKNRLFHRDDPLLEKPEWFSNVPIIINKKTGEMTKELKKEYLLELESIPNKSIMTIDELGSFASQFDFNNRNVTQTLDDMIRFYRHYTKGGYLICNDQCSENINFVIRRRLNIVNNVANCFVFWRLCFYYERMVSISEEIKTIDMRSQTTDKENDTQNNMCLRFKFLFTKKDYDTYAHSDRYKTVPRKDFNTWEDLKVYKVLRCPRDDDKKKPFIVGKVIDPQGTCGTIENEKKGE